MLTLDGNPLTPAQLETVARAGEQVALGEAAREAIARSRAVVEAHLDDGEAHYGINTGFGSLARVRIGGDELGELQRNLVRSHAAGIGEPLPPAVVRGMLVLLAASLARGYSGVRVELVEAIVGLLNTGVTPVVPEVGSVGASGDLAPLAHLALVLMGEGEAFVGDERLPGAEALSRAGLEPVELHAKEGLALINGTHLMASRAALLVRDFDRVFDAAVVAAALTVDACKGTDASFDERVYAVRPHPGAVMAAERLRALLAGSEILPSHREGDPRVQDPYSLRCAAVALGSAWDAAGYVKLAIERELGAVTDNPLVFPDGSIISAGNFHGLPLAVPLDALAVPIAHLAGVSERRTYHMLSARDPEAGLTPYLARKPGVQSGLMIAQYTAAACCNEIIGLCTPASVANIPTSAGVEDYNSFGPRSAAKARRALDLAARVVAIELICARHAIGLHKPLRTGAKGEAMLEKVRGVVRPLEGDRSPAPDIEAVGNLVLAGAFVE